jgi:dolichol-phosphate mannosyltransferase
MIRLWRFNLICLAGIVWSVLLLNLQVHGLHLNVFLANFNAIVLVSLWNFLLSQRFGWAARQRDSNSF